LEEEADGAADSLEVEDVVVEDVVVLAVLEGLLLTPLRKMITLTKTMTPVKRTTMDLEDLVVLTMTTTMTMTMTTMTTTTDVIEVVVSEGLLVDVRTVLAPPVRTIRDQTPARMGQLLPGFRLVQLEDGRGAPTTKDLSALMEAGDSDMLWFENQYCIIIVIFCLTTNK